MSTVTRKSSETAYYEQVPGLSPLDRERVSDDRVNAVAANRFSLMLNSATDCTWAMAAALGSGLNLRATSALPSASLPFLDQITAPAWQQQFLTQSYLSLLAMVPVLIGYVAYCKANNKPISVADIMAKILGPLLSIGMWNMAQTLGLWLATKASVAASFLATNLIVAPLVGIFSGLTQWLVPLILKLATDATERAKYKENPALLIKEFFLNITIGMIPGALWQVLYAALLPVLIPLGPGGLILFGLIIAASVMAANYTTAKVIDFFKEWMDKQKEPCSEKIPQILSSLTPVIN